MRTLGIAALLALAVGVGCKPGSNLPQPAAAIPIAVTEVRYDALDAAVQERKGKVVMVDFWATWCGPCRDKFPHFVEVHKKFADQGLVCMSVSLDPRGKEDEYDKAVVLEFLKDKEATFPNFVLLGFPVDGEKVRERFGLGDGIPFQVLFGKDGAHVWTSREKKLTGGELHKLIETELAK